MTPLARDEALLRDRILMYGEYPSELDSLDALARIVGQARAAEQLREALDDAHQAAMQARDYEQALHRIANPLPCDCDDGVSECYCMTMPSAVEIARAALAGAGVTDNERTAAISGEGMVQPHYHSGFPPGFKWSDEEQRPVYKGTADSPRTPAEILATGAAWITESELAALVALADRYREALRKFGRHDFGCPAGRGERNERGKCNCGLSAVLAGGAGDE